MKINLKAKEKEEFAKYISVLDTNIEEGEYFNEILSSSLLVNKQKEPFEIKELLLEEYLENPYYEMVKPSKAKEGNIHLCYDKYVRKEGFVYDEIILGDYMREKTPFGYFNEDFHFLSLKEKGTTWMSVTPHEINTMKENVKEAYGDVIVLGLGLGYFPFMISNKPNVKTITIIENNANIVDIFAKHLAPFFPHLEKIRILEDDAFSFLSKDFKGNYLFADLWHLPEDGLPLYCKILSFEKEHRGCQFAYWIEKSMLALLRRAAIILLDEEMNGSGDEDYRYEETFSDHLINEVHRALEDKEINAIQDIEELLSFKSLKDIARKLKF